MVSTPPQHSTTLQAFKMSAIQMIIANIQSLNDAERAQVLSHFAAAPAKTATPLKDVGSAKDLEPKKQNANKGRPTCHGDFVKKILEEKKDAAAAYKLENPEQKGSHLVFVANYKKEHPEEFAAFEAAWKEAHPKAEAAPKEEPEVVIVEPVAAVAEAKPKRVMTDEQKAKMKAGREAAKAKRTAEVDQTVANIEATIEAEIVAGASAKAAAEIALAMAAELMGHGEVPEPVAAPVQQVKKRGPKKLEDMTPEERAKHDAKKAERQAKKAADKAAGRPTVDTDDGSEVSAPSVPSARSASPKLKDE